MATGGLNDESDSLGSTGLECPICLEIYTDPRALVCLHTFCLKCLDVLVLKAKEEGKLFGGVDCPICRTRTKMNTDLSPEQWSKELPRNYALAEALQTLNKGLEMDRTPLCQSCIDNNESHKAIMFCLTCAQYQCQECVSSHKRFKSMKAHTLVELDKCEKAADIVDFTQLLNCHEHNKLIEFYCKDHGQLCCTTCAIITHKRCDNIEIRNVDKKVNDKDVKKDLAHMIRNIEHVCRKMTENENDINLDISKIEDNLSLVRRTVMKRLDMFEKEIRDNMQQKMNSVKSINGEIRAESNRLIAALEGSINMVDIVTQNGSLENKFVAMEKLKQQCQLYGKSIDKLFVEAETVHMKLNVDDSLTHVSGSIGQLGKVEIVSKKLSVLKRSMNLKVFKSFDMMAEEAQEEPLVTGIGFLSDGRIAMVDNINDEFLIMCDSLVQKTSCKLSFKPLCLTVVKTDEILITSGTSVYIYVIDGENVLTLKSSTDLQLKCYSISEIDSDTFAVSCYDTSTPFNKVTRQGKVSLIVGEYPDMNFGIEDLMCSYSRMDDCLVVTLRKLDEIRVVDTKYNTTTVIKDDTIIKCPRAVAVANGTSRSFFVCSEDTHSIVRVSFDGIILGNHKFTDMIFPCCIAITNDKAKLIVSNCAKGNMKVGLYKLTCDK